VLTRAVVALLERLVAVTARLAHHLASAAAVAVPITVRQVESVVQVAQAQAAAVVAAQMAMVTAVTAAQAATHKSAFGCSDEMA